MKKREEVAAELAEELGWEVFTTMGEECWWIKTTGQIVPATVRDALISREMRVRELEATLASIVECQVEDVDGCGACVDAARLALNSKGEKNEIRKRSDI